MLTHNPIKSQHGIAMVEVLFTMFILLIGILGLAGIQVRVANANVESYQRAQALVLLSDMVERFNATRILQTCYNYSSPTTGYPYLGQDGGDGHLLTPTTTSVPCAVTGLASTDTMASSELASWAQALKGAAETNSVGSVGSMAGARGCIYSITDTATTPNMQVYTIAVSWQGTNSTVAPPANATCGMGLYGDETKRRTVWTTVRVAALG